MYPTKLEIWSRDDVARTLRAVQMAMRVQVFASGDCAELTGYYRGVEDALRCVATFFDIEWPPVSDDSGPVTATDRVPG